MQCAQEKECNNPFCRSPCSRYFSRARKILKSCECKGRSAAGERFASAIMYRVFSSATACPGNIRTFHRVTNRLTARKNANVSVRMFNFLHFPGCDMCAFESFTDFLYLLIRHPVRAKLLYQFFQSEHFHPPVFHFVSPDFPNEILNPKQTERLCLRCFTYP